MIEVIGDRASGRRLQRTLRQLAPQAEGVVNWTGAPLPDSLNSMARSDKLKQLIALELAGVKVPLYMLSEPSPREWMGEWLPRRANHEQGRDFTSRGFEPAYWVQKVDTVGEWRIHAFRTTNGKAKSIKASEKRPIPGFPDPHPWVRNHRLGWGQYNSPSPRPIRELALKALDALHLDFGAVDVGVLGDGNGIVFEVNTCPGLTGDTLLKYAEEIIARCDS